MSTDRGNEINVLRLTLHGRLVGYLAGFLSGRNVLSFADEFKEDATRPTFSLIPHPNFPHSDKLMTEPWARNQRLHPSISNLLPEGALRELTLIVTQFSLARAEAKIQMKLLEIIRNSSRLVIIRTL